jgi:TonB family protein
MARPAGRVSWAVALVAAVLWPATAPFAWRSVAAPVDAAGAVTRLPALIVIPNRIPDAAPWSTQLDLLLAVMWLCASLLLLAHLALALQAVARAQREGKPRFVDGVPVLVTRGLGPAVAGVRRPRIVVPEWLLDLDAALRTVVLRHEQEHCRARDHWLILGAAIATALVPWNPAVWWIAKRLRLALEVDCDARVLRRHASAERYGKLLLLVAQRQSVTRLAPVLAASNSHLHGRILAMSRPQPDRPVVRCALFAAVALIAAVAACSSKVDKTPTQPEERMSQSAAVPTATAPRLVQGNRSAPTLANGAHGYFEFQVEKPVLPLAGNPSPTYPRALEGAHMDGEVLAQFVVDTAGHVDVRTFKVLKSSHDLFTTAVKDVLPALRFSPAQVGGRNVTQLVQMPFAFKAR